MESSSYSKELESLRSDLMNLIDRLPTVEHSELIQQALTTLTRLTETPIDRLDWKVLTASLRDMERAFGTFYPYRRTRKITIFGSARVTEDSPDYQMAVEFARRITQQGFMVITGGGGGIMQAGNQGAGPDQSFGLNIQLPFEQGDNPYIQGSSKLVNFKYFFTRKLFFLRESDALALFPGGFGTQDEAFECLTLSQTGKSAPVPLVLIEPLGSTYWHDWNEYIVQNLLKGGLISPEDTSLYTITDNVDLACQVITSFYLVYHSSRYVGDRLIIRLKTPLSDAQVEELNDQFSDILVQGRIEKIATLPQEAPDITIDLPRLALYFNQRDLGRLYQMLRVINRMGTPSPAAEHPERK
ncbi:MAG: LOG family protein [Leptolyngbyaceae cyanobacterium bins.59]|nr:LOG family protein [Leptolyngbyaceae cyanobacterium bins.59]